MDIEEGHLLPSFGLADALRKDGHQVLYLSIEDNKEIVRQQGFDFQPVFVNTYPVGFREKYKRRNNPDIPEWDHLKELIAEPFEQLIRSLHADLFIISAFLKFDILLLHYRFNIRPVIFTTFLRAPGRRLADDCIADLMRMPVEVSGSLIDYLVRHKIKVSSMKDLVAPINELKEFVACPPELDFPSTEKRDNVFYLGASIRQKDDDPALLEILRRKGKRKLIFASLGSQIVSYGLAYRDFFSKMISVMQEKELEDAFLVLCIGPDLLKEEMNAAGENVMIVNWISQTALLEHTDLALTHGGIGTLKECIYYGVPVIVLPVTRDQPDNALRIVHHGLGETADILQVQVSELRMKMLGVMGNDMIRTKVNTMKALFRQQDQENTAGRLVRELLKQTLTIQS
jgi:MGT family glycosyltransferase